jgi:hypothetical protein
LGGVGKAPILSSVRNSSQQPITPSLILIWSIFIACPAAVTADDVGAAGDEAIVPRARVRYHVAAK